jgi:hypothetical protein
MRGATSRLFLPDMGLLVQLGRSFPPVSPPVRGRKGERESGRKGERESGRNDWWVISANLH